MVETARERRVPVAALLDEALGPRRADHRVRRVSLAFDEKVILKDVSFTLTDRHTKMILGASGAGKSTILEADPRAAEARSRAIFVNGERVDDMTEDELMARARDLGMVFQEGALFDSLTVRENVGYKLFEELNCRSTRRPARRGGARVRRPRRVHRSDAVGAVGRPAPPRGDRPGDGAKPRILLYDEPTTGLDPITALTVDEEIIKLRDLEGVSSILVTHQLRDAFYVAEHTAAATDGDRLRFEARRARRRTRRSSSCCATAGSPSKATRSGAARVREGRLHSSVSLVEVIGMPRTRSLAWSELKIGMLGIVALVALALAARHRRGGGAGGLLLAALRAEDQVPGREGAQGRGRGARGGRRGRQGQRRRASATRGRGRARGQEGHAAAHHRPSHARRSVR